MSLEATDQASEAVRKGFRITLAYMKTRISTLDYFYHDQLTIAVITLDNGWKLTGKSAPVDPNNYDAEHGKSLAYDDALRQAWPLFAFSYLEGTTNGSNAS